MNSLKLIRKEQLLSEDFVAKMLDITIIDLYYIENSPVKNIPRKLKDKITTLYGIDTTDIRDL